jgi:hypothetical protein
VRKGPPIHLSQSFLVALRHTDYCDEVELELIFGVKRTSSTTQFPYDASDFDGSDCESVDIGCAPGKTVKLSDDESAHTFQLDFFFCCPVDFS